MMKEFRIEKWFAIYATIFLGIMIFVMPINRVPDEMNHARMTWNILYKDTNHSFKWMDSVSADSNINKQQYKELFTEKIDLSKEQPKIAFTLRNISHIPQLIGMMIGKVFYPSIGVMVTLGRIMNAIVYILGVYLLLKKLCYGKTVLCFLSLLPIMLQQAASLSYDVINYLAIMTFFYVLTVLSTEKTLTRQHLLGIALSSIFLYITKTNNLLLIFLLFTLSLTFTGTLSKLNKPIEAIKTFFWRYKYILVILLSICLVAFVFLFRQQTAQIMNLLHVLIRTVFDNNQNGHLNTILTVGMFGYLGNFTIQLPLWLIFADVAVLTLLYVLDRNVILNKFFGIAAALMVIIQISAIIVGMYIEWTPLVLGENAPISVGAQGRYFTPFLIYLLPLFMSFRNELRLEYNKKVIHNLIFMTATINFVISLALVIPYYWI